MDRGTGRRTLFFVFADGSLITPPLSGTILPGITRESLLALARDEGLAVRESAIRWISGTRMQDSGALVETFACGTAAVVTPVGKVTSSDGEFVIGSGGPGQTTQKLRQRVWWRSSAAKRPIRMAGCTASPDRAWLRVLPWPAAHGIRCAVNRLIRTLRRALP